LLSDWVEKIPGVKRIIISQDYKIKNKSCYMVGIKNGKRWKNQIKKNAHFLPEADCFQYYNPEIIKFIESKI